MEATHGERARGIIYSAVLTGLAVSSALGILVAQKTDLQSSSMKGDFLAGLSAGVLLAVAFLHLLDDAQDMLDGLCDYPAANAAALFGVMTMATAQAIMPCIHRHPAPCHSNGVPLLTRVDSKLGGSELSKFYALEASVSLHSVLIGLGLGFARMEWKELLILGVALSVHQFFEGLAIGMVAKRSQLSRKGWLVTLWVFTLSLPVGGGAGMAATRMFANVDSSDAYLWLSGLLNAFAAGLLMQIGLEMINSELNFESDTDLHNQSAAPAPVGHSIRLGLKVLSISTGALLFGVLAIWA